MPWAFQCGSSLEAQSAVLFRDRAFWNGLQEMLLDERCVMLCYACALTLWHCFVLYIVIASTVGNANMLRECMPVSLGPYMPLFYAHWLWATATRRIDDWCQPASSPQLQSEVSSCCNQSLLALTSIGTSTCACYQTDSCIKPAAWCKKTQFTCCMCNANTPELETNTFNIYRGSYWVHCLFLRSALFMLADSWQQ